MGTHADIITAQVVSQLIRPNIQPGQRAFLEFNLQRFGWADLALLGKRLHLYEIKSAADNVRGLVDQLWKYSAVCTELTVVAHVKHRRNIRRLDIPWWVGITTIDDENNLRVLIPAAENPEPEMAWAWMLLAYQAKKMCREVGIWKSMERKDGWACRDALQKHLSLEELRDRVLTQLRISYLSPCYKCVCCGNTPDLFMQRVKHSDFWSSYRMVPQEQLASEGALIEKPWSEEFRNATPQQ